MTKLTVDEQLPTRLLTLQERAEIRNGEGKLLGFFIPAEDNRTEEEKRRYAEARKLFDPEEIKRRKERSKNDPGRTLEQIMERLDALERGE